MDAPLSRTTHRSPIQAGGTARQRGFGMIEVLVAVLVLAIGLLGLAVLQVKGAQYNRSAFSRTQSTVLAYDLIERIRANKTGSDAAAYCLGQGSASSCTVKAPPSPAETCSSGCTSATQLAKYDLTQWFQLVNSSLVASSDANKITQIVREGTTIGGKTVAKYTITIYWQDADQLASEALMQTWEFHI